jgi:hypothetical protein
MGTMTVKGSAVEQCHIPTKQNEQCELGFSFCTAHHSVPPSILLGSNQLIRSAI